MIKTPEEMAQAIEESLVSPRTVLSRWASRIAGVISRKSKQPTIDEMIRDLRLRTALAMDGDTMTGLDQSVARSGNQVINIDTLFARDGDIETKRDRDRALDGNVVTQTLHDETENSQAHKKPNLPSPWDHPPTPSPA